MTVELGFGIAILAFFIVFAIILEVITSENSKCPKCGKHIEMIDNDLDREYTCPKCGHKFTFYNPYDY